MSPKTSVKKPSKKAQTKRLKQGDRYECSVCGLVVTIDEECGCVDTCDIICCGKPLRKKK